MKWTQELLSRRHLMKRFGHAALVFPFLRVLEEERLLAATPASRAIFWYFPDGIIKPLFHPVGAASAFPTITAPLMRVRDDITLLRGVEYKTEGSHEGGAAYCLTGCGPGSGGVSLDTYLGEVFQASSALPVVRLGVGANFQRNGGISYIAPGIPSVIEDHPQRAFYSLFGASQEPIDPVIKEKIMRGEKSILDLSMGQLRDLSGQIGERERQKLEVHIEALRELERRVQTAGQISNDRLSQCTESVDMRGLSFPDQDHTYPSMEHRNENFGAIGSIITDLVVQALACGLTRVALLQWSHPVSPTQFSPAGYPDLGRGHHDISHYGGDASSSYAREFVNCQSWYMNQLAQFIEQLKSIKIGDQNLLDQSALLALTEIGDSNLHDFTDVGLILAGKAGGRLKTGQIQDAKGASHNQVLVTILQAMGQSADTFGDPQKGRGPLKSLQTT